MNRSRRVVLDTCTLVSAALYTGSVPDQARSKIPTFEDVRSIEELVKQVDI